MCRTMSRSATSRRERSFSLASHRCIHLAVVDPGVGTSRRPLALSTARGDLLVGPDNGLLIDAGVALGGIVAAWDLDMGKIRSNAGLPPERVSTTFHGRDLFAPASALLAAGVEPLSLGSPLDVASLVRLALAPPQTTEGRIPTPVKSTASGTLGWDFRSPTCPRALQRRALERRPSSWSKSAGMAPPNGPLGWRRPTVTWPPENSDSSEILGARLRSRSTGPAQLSFLESDEAWWSH